MRTCARAATTLVVSVLLAGCAGAPEALPTIGSPTPTPTPSATPKGRADQLAEDWSLHGAALPTDWPDVPLPKGTEVITAYAIGSAPRRTWTATFAGDDGTAQDLAAPVVAELRQRGYVPIAEYVGTPESNTGLYSFAAPSFAVYVVLGEDAGRPNVVITVRGSTGDEGVGATDDPALSRPGQQAGGPSSGVPASSPTPTPPQGSSAPGVAGSAGAATPATTASSTASTPAPASATPTEG